MATNLTSVTLTAPSVDPDIPVDSSFVMTITGGYSGGGGVTSHDFYWEWDQGIDSWQAIPASGGSAGLYTNDTNPLTGKTTTDPETITVYGDAAGVFKIRAHGVRGVSNYYDPSADPWFTVTVTGVADLSIDIDEGEESVITVTDVPTVNVEAQPDPQINVYSEVDVDAELGVTVAVQDKAPYEINVFDEPSIEESVDLVFELVVDVYDEPSVDEWADLAPELVISTGDDPTVEESVDLALELVPNIFDSVSVDATDVTVDLPEVGGDLEPDVFDSPSIEEDVTVLLGITIDVFDSVTVDENTDQAFELVPSVFDSVSIEELTNLAFELVPNIYDEITVVCDTTVTVVEEGVDLDIDIFSTVSVADKVPWYISVHDTKVTVTLSDEVYINVFDSPSIAEFVTFEHHRELNVFSSVTVDDSPTVELGVATRTIGVYDSITLDENVQGVAGDLNINVSDEVSIAEYTVIPAFYILIDGNILFIDEVLLVIPDMTITPDLPETVVGVIEGTWDIEEIFPEVEVDIKLGRIKVELLDES
jgi:hypothetical protein